jgi:hypothetical protein
MVDTPVPPNPLARTPVLQIDPVTNRVTIVVRDGQTFALIPSLLDTAIQSAEYRPGMEILIDCRASHRAPGAATVRLLAEALSDCRDVRGPVAVLAPDEHIFGMGRMLEILVGMRGDLNVRVFDHEPELESWLRRTSVTDVE